MAVGRSAGDPFRPASAGASLGVAHGRITIDTSDAERARATMQRVGRDTAQAIKPIQTAIAAANKDLSAFRGEMVAIGAAGAVMAKIGLTGARNIRAYATTFAQLTGSQREANQLMADLTEQADRFGINVYEVWQLARALLPTLEGNTEELDEFVKRAALLASTNPLKSTADAARAIQEYLSGQYISIQRLFNIDPALIMEARQQFEGVGDQLDYILDRMGATEEAALQMADAFVAVRNELTLALATGFTPLFNKLQPMARDFRVLIQELRETNPAALEAGAGIASIATAGSAALLVLNQVLGATQRIARLGPVGRGLFATGASGIAVAGGVGLGLAGTRAIGRATGNEELQQANIDTLAQRLSQMLVIVTEQWLRTSAVVTGQMAIMVRHWASAIADTINGLGLLLQWLGQFTPGSKLDDAGQRVLDFATKLDEAGVKAAEALLRSSARQSRAVEEFVLGLAGVRLPSFDTELAHRPPFAGGSAAGGAQEFSQEELQLAEDYLADLQSIQDQARQEILSEERSFGQERASIVADNNRTLLREEEDWRRQQARALEDLNSDIAGIRADAIEREAEAAASLQERLAEIRADGTERVLDIEEDARDKLEKLQRDHRNTLLEAAARLDARAVAEEQRRFASQTGEIADDLQERVEQERENLQERIEQEQEAHEERLRDQRVADDERVRDMQRFFRERQRRENEDRNIRLQRMHEDQVRQLQEFDAAHLERISQIRRNAQLEQTERERSFRSDLIGLDDHWESRLRLENRWEGRALEMLRDYWKSVTDMIPASVTEQDRRNRPWAYLQHGGYVDYTGPAMVHGTRGKPEYMLDAGTTSALERMLGGALSPSRLVGALAGGGAAAGTNMQVSFVINGAPGQSETKIGAEVERVLTNLFRGMA